MPDIAVKAENGIEVYTHEIYRILDQYIKEQPDGEEALQDVHCFAGLMKRIAREVFTANANRLYDLRTTINTEDALLISDLWDIYTMLCTKYRHRITLLRFSVMTNISMQTFNNWKHERYRSATNAHVETMKKILTECESSLADGALESNSIGCIFGLKANFSWRETAPAAPEDYITTVQSTPEQIRERYKDAKKPEIPQLD